MSYAAVVATLVSVSGTQSILGFHAGEVKGERSDDEAGRAHGRT
jgi:hypothetical protein